MKIYTKTGDDGSTGLYGGERVSKADPRIECIGSVDELNAAIGWAAVAAETELQGRLRMIQSELFTIGWLLATPKETAGRRNPVLDQTAISRLEGEIDAMDGPLPQLKNFILPGGSEAAARLHLARTLCRRAERIVVTFAATQAVPSILVVYLNRLSDWLFTAARSCNHRAGIAETPWLG